MRAVAKVLLAATLVVAGLAHAAATDVTVRWTGPGIPHVTAADYEGLGYGHGYAVARDRVCLLADRIVTLRGERSRWFGPDQPAVVGFLPTTNLNSDLFHRVQLSDASVAEAMKPLDPKVLDLARGYAAGFNRFVSEVGERDLAARCGGAPILQMSEADVVRAMQSIGTIWKAFQIAVFAQTSVWGSDARQAQTLQQPEPISASLGSNAWAYGADATRTGSAIVVGNPHSVWRGHWLSMHQMHLTIPGEIDVAGADFAGLPLPVTGFNHEIAWSIEAPSTVTYFVLQRLAVEESETPTYVVDGKRKPLTVRPVELQVKKSDGSVATERFPIAYSEYGPIYRLPAYAGRPAGWYAVTDAGDSNALGLNQLLHMAKSRDVTSFVAGVERHRGIGAHLIAGDRHGDVVYVESGPMLDVSDAALDDCRLKGDGVPVNVLDGTRGECLLRTQSGTPRTLANDKFPLLRGRGVIQNTNNSYRFSMYGKDTQGYTRLLGDAHAEPVNLRLRMSQRRMDEITRDGKVSDAEALAVIFDNRNYAAEAWLDSLLSICPEKGEAPEGCATLRAWDRTNDIGSRGALLFGEFWKRLGRVDALFAQQPDATKPFAVPQLVKTDAAKQRIASALAEAVKALKALGLDGAEPWGQILSARSATERVQLHGGPADQGVLNAMEGRGLGRDGFAAIASGTDYVQLVQWKDGSLVAQTVLAHGQSDDPRSKHFADQLQSLSTKQLMKFPFRASEVAADPQLVTLRLRGGDEATAQSAP